MTQKRIIKCALLVAGLAICCESQTQAKMPAGWVETPGPAGTFERNIDLQCANYSRSEWRVGLKAAGQLEIIDSAKQKATDPVLPPRFVRTKGMVGRRIVVKAGDGWLVGFNAGEFGGGLWWANADGSETRALTGKNVQAIVPRANDVLVFTGLAHLSMDEGTIYSYGPAVGRTGDFVRIADVDSAPTAATLLDDGTVLFSTHTGILKLSSENAISKLYSADNMSVLYPNSIDTDQAGTIFVGMRFYVLRLDHRSNGAYTASWFVRSNCTKVKIRDFDCVCTGK